MLGDLLAKYGGLIFSQQCWVINRAMMVNLMPLPAFHSIEPTRSYRKIDLLSVYPEMTSFPTDGAEHDS
jgi:hypothetical protein